MKMKLGGEGGRGEREGERERDTDNKVERGKSKAVNDKQNRYTEAWRLLTARRDTTIIAIFWVGWVGLDKIWGVWKGF